MERPLTGRDEELRKVVAAIRPGAAARPFPLGAFAGLLDDHAAIVLHRVVVRRMAPVVVTPDREPAPATVTSLWKDGLLPRLTWPHWTSPWRPAIRGVRGGRPYRRSRLLDEAAALGGLTTDRVPTVIPGFGLADLQVLGHCLAGHLTG
ncbi:MAG: hypothetical protein ACXWDL_04025 [Nocardioides sp.]